MARSSLGNCLHTRLLFLSFELSARTLGMVGQQLGVRLADEAAQFPEISAPTDRRASSRIVLGGSKVELGPWDVQILLEE